MNQSEKVPNTIENSNKKSKKNRKKKKKAEDGGEPDPNDLDATQKKENTPEADILFEEEITRFKTNLEHIFG